jgi:hypothetical protein
VYQLDELQGWGESRPCILLCGGPSAPSDLAQAKARIGTKDYDLVSVNNHGLLFLGELAWCYAHDVRMVMFLREYETPAIVHHDPKNLRPHDINGGIVPFIRLSGPEALWTADYFGYSEIHICGVDFYAGNRRYWYQWNEERRPTHFSEDQQGSWQKAKEEMQNPERVILYNERLQRTFQ